MRLFIAIDLPSAVKDYLRTMQARLPQARPSRSKAKQLTRLKGATFQMSKTRDFHLTLKFLGSCEEKRRQKIEENLRGIPFQPFEAALIEIGTFGGDKPRVIWVGMKVPPWLAESVREIENRMAKLGFEKEYRFAPHITLARVKFVEDPQAFAAALKKIKIEPHAFSVQHFYLFESRLSPKGAVHTKLAGFP